jgi:glycosyltransferase involved in cell wall biosynthesis
MDSIRNVLLIAYHFPPLGGSGVQRSVKFAKYLSRYGWKATVLTIEPAGYYAFDESLVREVEEAGVHIIRTKSFDIYRLSRGRKTVPVRSEFWRTVVQWLGDFFFLPDTKIGWKRNALRKGLELLRAEKFDLIFATAPPSTDFLIGAELKRKTGIPLVVDYRDAWLEDPFKYFPTPLHRWLHARLEKQIQKAADRVLVANRRVKEILLKRFPQLTYHDVIIIPHGFDPEDIPASTPRRTDAKKMRIVHAGMFRGGRTPAPLLTAFANLVQQDAQWVGRIEFEFVGAARKDEKNLVRSLGLESSVAWRGYLEHRECLRALAGADVLWYARESDILAPGILYEYFGMRKPILASVVAGYTQQLLDESRGAYVVPLGDIHTHEIALQELYGQFEKRKLQRVTEEFGEQFWHTTLTGELAKQFESLMEYDRGTFVKLAETA